MPGGKWTKQLLDGMKARAMEMRREEWQAQCAASFMEAMCADRVTPYRVIKIEDAYDYFGVPKPEEKKDDGSEQS
jgi:hypothetical protein